MLREVARRTGVSHNAAYRHFSDREELLAEVAAGRAWTGSSRRCATGWPRCAPATRSVGRYAGCARPGGPTCDFALAEPGLFTVAFSTPFEDERARAGPTPCSTRSSTSWSRSGRCPPDRRDGADVLCWADVHGFAMLHLSGPLRDVPEQEREPLLERCLDLVELALVP